MPINRNGDGHTYQLVMLLADILPVNCHLRNSDSVLKATNTREYEHIHLSTRFCLDDESRIFRPAQGIDKQACVPSLAIFIFFQSQYTTSSVVYGHS